MAVKSVIMINFLLRWLTYGLAEEPPIAQPGCKAQCGHLRVPHPFGMDSSHSFLKKINMEVLEITITSGNGAGDNTVRVTNSIIDSNSSCVTVSNEEGMNIKGSPFVFSDFMSTFVSVGFKNWATMAKTDAMVVGCKSHCNNTSSINKEQQRHKCLGLNCCQTTIPSGLQEFNVDFRDIDNNSSRDDDEELHGYCNKFAFLVDEKWFLSQVMISPFSVERMKMNFPMVLEWWIYNWTKKFACDA
ncbi:hypothetical protein ACB092_11G070100 [Castanea dentata]